MSNNSDLAKAEKSVSAAEAAVGNAQAVVADLEVKRASARLWSKSENREARERFAASQRRNTV